MSQYKGIGQIAITVSNLGAATAFYRDRVGLDLMFEVPGMSFFDGGGVRLMFGEASREDQVPGSSIVYFRVDDIQAAHERLVAKEVPCEREPLVAHRAEDRDLWLAFYRDPEKNLFALMSEVPR